MYIIKLKEINLKGCKTKQMKFKKITPKIQSRISKER